MVLKVKNITDHIGELDRGHATMDMAALWLTWTLLTRPNGQFINSVSSSTFFVHCLVIISITISFMDEKHNHHTPSKHKADMLFIFR